MIDVHKVTLKAASVYKLWYARQKCGWRFQQCSTKKRKGRDEKKILAALGIDGVSVTRYHCYLASPNRVWELLSTCIGLKGNSCLISNWLLLIITITKSKRYSLTCNQPCTELTIQSNIASLYCCHALTEVTDQSYERLYKPLLETGSTGSKTAPVLGGQKVCNIYCGNMWVWESSLLLKFHPGNHSKPQKPRWICSLSENLGRHFECRCPILVILLKIELERKLNKWMIISDIPSNVCMMSY